MDSGLTGAPRRDCAAGRLGPVLSGQEKPGATSVMVPNRPGGWQPGGRAMPLQISGPRVGRPRGSSWPLAGRS